MEEVTLPLGFASSFDEQFATGAARAFWVNAWADAMEEAGQSLSGELMDQAPPTPLAAFVLAGELMGRMSAVNGVGVAVLAARAAEAEGLGHDPTEIDAAEFGHYMAMQAGGHGVSWFDDHAEFDFMPLGVDVETAFDIDADDLTPNT